MKRRDFLMGAGAGAVISTMDWLRYFKQAGVPGTAKSLGLAEAHAAEAATLRFLVYWYQEGGWDGYSMFNPMDSRNDATLNLPAGELYPNPDWKDQLYRPVGYNGLDPAAVYGPAKTQGNITYGYLANDGLDLFSDLAVVSSMHGNAFHSGGRFDSHYGTYSTGLQSVRQSNERTVMQAFCEAYGAGYLMPHVSWHRWIADGELAFANYPEGTGYYEKLGPPHAHTLYGKTPADMRMRLKQIGSLSSNARDDRIRAFVDNLNSNFMKDKNSESVKAFSSAVAIYKSQTGQALSINPNTMFTDSALREEFGITAADESSTSSSINEMPARSKESPNTNVQALMAYELMTKGLSIGFWIENRDLRLFDTHVDRKYVLDHDGQADQMSRMRNNLWTPLKAFVNRLKNTPLPDGSGSYYDVTTIVLASEMGRTIGETDASGVISDPKNDTDAKRYAEVMKQDVCNHWHVTSAAFLGGTVQGNRQYGRVGKTSQDAIRLLPDGKLDPAYDPVTGLLKPGSTAAANSYIPDAGSVYATALYLTGLDPDGLRAQGKGRNTSAPMRFIKKA